eukprot:694536-Prymnesium_polylepis.1
MVLSSFEIAAGRSYLLISERETRGGRGCPKSTNLCDKTPSAPGVASLTVDRTRPCASYSGANDSTHRSRKLP